MPTMIRKRITSADADVLSGTLLASAGPGKYTMWLVSTVDTATVTISAPGQQIAAAENIQESATDVAIKVNENLPWVIVIPPGGGVQPTIAVAGTTGTVVIQVRKG